MPTKHDPCNHPPISPVRAIAMILAHGVLRLQQRQKALELRTEQRVHDRVLNPKGVQGLPSLVVSDVQFR